jgi:glycerol-3-phosphate dehydrogenase (NAD(P)+)
MKEISVIGAGGWGTALSVVLAQNCEKVTLWARRGELSQLIRETGQNPDYLPGVVLPENVFATSDLEEAVRGRDTLVLAAPSHAVRATARLMAPFVVKALCLLTVPKGWRRTRC